MWKQCRPLVQLYTFYLLCGFVIFTIYVSYNRMAEQDVNEGDLRKELFKGKSLPSGVSMGMDELFLGLGNQLFLFACSYSISRTLNISLYSDFDLSKKASDNGFASPFKRGLLLDRFELQDDPYLAERMRTLTLARHSVESLRIKYYTLKEEELLWGNREIGEIFANLSATGSTVILQPFSFCISEEFFYRHREEIRELFRTRVLGAISKKLKKSQKALFVLRKIKAAGNSAVMVHVRKGDYRNRQDVPLSFYIKGMSVMENLLERNLTFFVFSDEIWTVKRALLHSQKFLRKFGVRKKVVFVEGLKSNLFEFYLMSQCKHAVISRSTYSWWAAYLMGNGNKNATTTSFGNATNATNATSTEEEEAKVVIGPVMKPEVFKRWPFLVYPKYAESKEFSRFLYTQMFFPNDWISLNY